EVHVLVLVIRSRKDVPLKAKFLLHCKISVCPRCASQLWSFLATRHRPPFFRHWEGSNKSRAEDHFLAEAFVTEAVGYFSLPSSSHLGASLHPFASLLSTFEFLFKKTQAAFRGCGRPWLNIQDVLDGERRRTKIAR